VPREEPEHERAVRRRRGAEARRVAQRADFQFTTRAPCTMHDAIESRLRALRATWSSAVLFPCMLRSAAMQVGMSAKRLREASWATAN
jgi:hypothetical protein